MKVGLDGLCALAQQLKRCSSDQERVKGLDQQPRVLEWLEGSSLLKECLPFLSLEEELIVKSLVAIGQVGSLLAVKGDDSALLPRLRGMLEDLFPVETFYKEMGGIVGYHQAMLSLLSAQEEEGLDQKLYHRPLGISIENQDDEVVSYVLSGIVSLPLLAEIYPVGGAADRLRFFDPASGQPLPAALLQFCGRSLLEGLIRDVQAREYLYYQLFGEQILTPIAMMTSSEKDNHRHILELCEKNHWFGRPKESFRIFCQPVVPTMDKEGKWCDMGAFKWLMKPGGHGVIWKAAQSEGVFHWLGQQGRTKVLVRQINNPIAGVDHGLLAFCGVGFRGDKTFGFASCPRRVSAAEGINVLVERKTSDTTHFCLTNIEYCDFPKFCIEDVPEGCGSVYSSFPSNTNILFADISAVIDALVDCPVPGMLVNLKKISFVDEGGISQEKEVVRLESTMQNLADCFGQTERGAVSKEDCVLKTYLTCNQRVKTISAIKKPLQNGESLLETPEGCFYDYLCNAYDLLVNHCGIQVPELPEMEAYLHRGPSFLFSYHPALGPLFSIIGQKLRGGQLALHSELILEIAEVAIDDLNLFGALHIVAEQMMGETDGDAVLCYSQQVGSVRMSNVCVRNRGIDPTVSHTYWKGEITRLEVCYILIRGNGLFVAENVTLHGAMCIEVEDGFKVTAFEEDGELKFKKEPLCATEKKWIYHINDQGAIEIATHLETSVTCREGFKN
jgi:UTP---glucose-1-phosphate uridylyltransferase